MFAAFGVHGRLMGFMVSHMSAARRPSGSPPSCFSSFSSPESWSQFEKSCVVNLGRRFYAELLCVNSPASRNCICLVQFITWDHHHCVSHHFLLQNDGFESKNRLWCVLVMVFLRFLRFMNSCTSQNLIFSAYFVTWDHRHCGSRHFLLQNDGFKSKIRPQRTLITRFLRFCVL